MDETRKKRKFLGRTRLFSEADNSLLYSVDGEPSRMCESTTLCWDISEVGKPAGMQ